MNNYMQKFTVEVIYSPVYVTVYAVDEDDAQLQVQEMLENREVIDEEQTITVGDVTEDVDIPDDISFDDYDDEDVDFKETNLSNTQNE